MDTFPLNPRPIAVLSASLGTHQAAGACHAPRATRHAFTLVELLVVILIIGMLMALLTTAVMKARQTARDTAVTLELSNIGLALDKFREAKSSGNVYPPDFGEILDGTYQTMVVLPYVRQAFPRYAGASGTFTVFRNNVVSRNSGVLGGAYDPIRLDPAEAVVFWLGGIPRFGTLELTGFSANPIDPFANSNFQAQRESRYYDFDARRLYDRDGDRWPEYYPPGSNPQAGHPPIVYFASRPGYPLWDGSGSGRHRYGGQLAFGAAGVAVPYAHDANNNGVFEANRDTWLQPEGYQLITAGVDNNYGTGAITSRAYPTQLSVGDHDNLTSMFKGRLKE